MLDQEAIYLKQLANLSLDEISLKGELDSVSSLSRRLFTQEIDKDTTELFRAMCILSQCSTKLNTSVTSHRPIVGKAIIFMKKLIWKFVAPQIEPTFNSIQDCFSYIIISHAKALSELKDLKNSKSS